MGAEDLLKPRYKVLMDYPYSVWDIGNILTSECNNEWFGIPDEEQYDGCLIHINIISKHPAIFYKLDWWVERKPIELPKYVKKLMEYDDTIFKIVNWRSSANTGNINGVYINENALLFIGDVVPATQEEYNKFISRNL